MAGGRHVAAVSVSCLLSIAAGVTAIVLPQWHVTHAEKHFHVGFFQRCEVRNGIDSSTECTTLDFPSEFCGVSEFDLQMRHGWSAGCAIAACVASLICVVVAINGYTTERWHPRWMLFFAIVASACMTVAISVFSHTYDGWLYCGYNYCAYAAHYLGSGAPCEEGYGPSFVFACVSLALSLVAALGSAMFVRLSRCGYLDDTGNFTAKVLVRKKTFLQKLDAARQVEDAGVGGNTPLPWSIRKRLPHESPALMGQQQTLNTTSPPPFLLRGGSASPRHARSRSPTRQRHVNLKSLPAADTHAHPDEIELAPVRASLSPAGARRGPAIHGDFDDLSVRGQREPEARGPGATADLSGWADWTYDSSTGLYWSEKEQLFLRQGTPQTFFDPSNGLWYDPAEGTWVDNPPPQEQ